MRDLTPSLTKIIAYCILYIWICVAILFKSNILCSKKEQKGMVILMKEEKRKDFDKFNVWWKDRLVNTIVPLLDDLRDSNKKEVNSICRSFVFMKNDDCECTANTIKLALGEICDSNPDIQGRVDVFDKIYGESVKGVTFLLFLKKDKDKFDYPDINRFYAEYPEFYTKIFNEEDIHNKFFEVLFESILAVKEKYIPFRLIQTKSIDGICSDFISNMIDKVKREGLKCKAIENMTSNNEEYVYFFIYETETEEMNKLIEPLERRSSFRLVK